MLKSTSISLLLLFFITSCSSGQYKVTRVEKSTERKVAQAASTYSFKSKSDQNLKTIAAILENEEVVKDITQNKDTFSGITYYGTNNHGVSTYSLHFEMKKSNKETQDCYTAIFVKDDSLQIEDYYDCPE